MSKYVMIDLEMCNVPRGTRGFDYKKEIIEIGAVLMDEGCEIIDNFCTLVKPEFGWVDDFIEKLTGIKQKDLRNAPSLEEAIKDFIEWLPAEEVVPISWSLSDKKQFTIEMTLKEIINYRIESMMCNWIDCQPMFASKMGNNRCYKLSEALIASDIITEGRDHDGLVDAYNTALLYKKMVMEPEFKLNPYYEIAHDDKPANVLEHSMGDMFAGLNLTGLAAC